MVCCRFTSSGKVSGSFSIESGRQSSENRWLWWQKGSRPPEEVDQIFAHVLGTAAGPFRFMDRVGLDVVLDIEEHYAALQPSLADSPRQLLREYTSRNWLGVKTGRGFYDDYKDRSEPALPPVKE